MSARRAHDEANHDGGHRFVLDAEHHLVVGADGEDVAPDLAEGRGQADLVGLVHPETGGDGATGRAHGEEIFGPPGVHRHDVHGTSATATDASSWRVPASRSSTAAPRTGSRVSRPGLGAHLSESPSLWSTILAPTGTS